MNAVCSSSDLSAKLIDEARSIARSEPSLSMTTPSRTSETGTKSCVDLLDARMLVDEGILVDERVASGTYHDRSVHGAALCFRRDASRDAFLDVERPREVMEFAFGEFWYVEVLCYVRRDGLCGRDVLYLALVVPEIEL